uniref:Uncharacterized protein n=1 Tax=Rhizophora mucronata TaxID=61149 RepID=A0A2P2JDY2_RHIMU
MHLLSSDQRVCDEASHTETLRSS